jgi:plasmid maintenance system antidote protein VapI
MRQKIHIGELIRSKLAEKERTVVWLAKKLSCDRTNIYRIFDSHHINTELLLRISVALDYNFFSCYTSLFNDIQANKNGCG